jgi:hypothetical protein
MANRVSLGRRTITIVPDLTDIGGLSKAAACVVTWTAHGLATGDHVSFQGITQADWSTALNGLSFPIIVLTANTFSIPVNTASIAVAYNASTDPGLVGTDFDIARMQSGRLPVGSVSGTFVAGEAVSQATSGAAGTVFRWDPQQNILYLVSVLGTFDATHTITGATSSATAIPSEVPYAIPNGIRLSKVDFCSSQVGDTLVIRERQASGPVIFARHRDANNSGFHRPVGGRSLKVYPYIMAAEQEWGVPANVQIILEFD